MIAIAAVLVCCWMGSSMSRIVVDDVATTHFLGLMQGTVDSAVSDLSGNMSLLLQTHPHEDGSVFKRSLSHNALIQKIQSHLSNSFAQPALASFHTELKTELQKGFDNYDRALKEQNPLTNAESKKMAKAHAKLMTRSINLRFGGHFRNRWTVWRNRHRFSWKSFHSRKSTNLVRRQEDDDTLTVWEKFKNGLKNGLLDPKKMSSQFMAGLIGFIVTMPAFFTIENRVMPGFAVMAWTLLFVQPIIDRMLLGYWFWQDN